MMTVDDKVGEKMRACPLCLFLPSFPLSAAVAPLFLDMSIRVVIGNNRPVMDHSELLWQTLDDRRDRFSCLI